MKRLQWLLDVMPRLMLCLGVLASGAAMAQPAETADELFNSKFCFACHSVKRNEVKKLGPFVVDIAAKHRGQSDAAQQLASKILHGSSGLWGDAKASVMPPNKVTPEEAALLAAWVLMHK